MPVVLSRLSRLGGVPWGRSGCHHHYYYLVGLRATAAAPTTSLICLWRIIPPSSSSSCLGRSPCFSTSSLFHFGRKQEKLYFGHRTLYTPLLTRLFCVMLLVLITIPWINWAMLEEEYQFTVPFLTNFLTTRIDVRKRLFFIYFFCFTLWHFVLSPRTRLEPVWVVLPRP